jgi:hypothetical protein
MQRYAVVPQESSMLKHLVRASGELVQAVGYAQQQDNGRSNPRHQHLIGIAGCHEHSQAGLKRTSAPDKLRAARSLRQHYIRKQQVEASVILQNSQHSPATWIGLSRTPKLLRQEPLQRGIVLYHQHSGTIAAGTAA